MRFSLDYALLFDGVTGYIVLTSPKTVRWNIRYTCIFAIKNEHTLLGVTLQFYDDRLDKSIHKPEERHPSSTLQRTRCTVSIR